MIKFEFENLTIEIYNDPTFSLHSTSNSHTYFKYYLGSGALDYPVSQYGIKILNDGTEINTCIIIGSGGATGINKSSALLDIDKVVICCCNTVFCLSVPSLELLWQTEADIATCFEIYKLDNDYIVHGELDISRIDGCGNIKWQFGGMDIWVSLGDKSAFTIASDCIQLFDFCNNEYRIDFNGKLLWSSVK